MNKEINFFGYTLTLATLLIFCGVWTFFICFIWPFIIGSYFFVTPMVCLFCLIAVFMVNEVLLFILALCRAGDKVVAYTQHFLIVLSSAIGTGIFCWVLHLTGFKAADHFLVNTFSIYLYYTLLNGRQ